MSDMSPPPLRVWLTIWVSNRSKCARLNAPVRRSMWGAKSDMNFGLFVLSYPLRAGSLPGLLSGLVEAIVVPNRLIAHRLNVLVVEVGRDGSRHERNGLANCLETTPRQRDRRQLPEELGTRSLQGADAV